MCVCVCVCVYVCVWERLATILPRFRPKVRILENDEGITSMDPADLTRIAANFWTKKWVRGEVHDPELLFRIYGKKIISQPKSIDIDVIEAAILSTNDSSPGPDGIPFRVYRDTIEHSAPIFLSCALALGKE